MPEDYKNLHADIAGLRSDYQGLTKNIERLATSIEKTQDDLEVRLRIVEAALLVLQTTQQNITGLAKWVGPKDILWVIAACIYFYIGKP